ncbi:hypothetical protein A3711_02790 [Erythrobacter sp. HI00D59]|nr:hypothetical protein A3711_02790 [Erythrobacter sp. HI00D59]
MWRTGGTIAAIRISTIALRFALTVYMTAFLGLVAVGQYGLIAGLAILAPALVGLGLNFHLCRDVAGEKQEAALALVRDRMRFSLFVLALVTVAGLVAHLVLLGPIPPMTLLVVGILWGEALGTDLYLGLTGMQRNILANLAVGLRSACWIPFAVLLGLAMPEMRTLDVVLTCWAIGTWASLFIVFTVLARSDPDRALHTAPPTGWVGRTVRAGMVIWPSDLALVLITFGDRFIMSTLVSDRELGIYVFFWTFANMVQTLLQSSLVTPALPRLVIRFRESREAWSMKIKQLAVLLLACSTVMAVGGLLFIWIGHRYVPQSSFPWNLVLGLLVFLGMVVRLLSDFLSTALNSAGFVRAYVATNIVYATLLLGAVAVGTDAFGIIGTAIAAITAGAIATLVKLISLSKVRTS